MDTLQNCSDYLVSKVTAHTSQRRADWTLQHTQYHLNNIVLNTQYVRGWGGVLEFIRHDKCLDC